jgi:hypothetical protein
MTPHCYEQCNQSLGHIVKKLEEAVTMLEAVSKQCGKAKPVPQSNPSVTPDQLDNFRQ